MELTTAELTSEEIVTRLLTSNQILKKQDSDFCVTNPGTSLPLGKFLESENAKNNTVNKGKYTFINLNSGWAW